MSKQTDFASKLANDHLAWVVGYNKALGLTIIPLAAAEYLYRTAMFHGAGHGIESERRGDFRPSIGESLSVEDVASISEGEPPHTCRHCIAYRCAARDNESTKYCTQFEPLGHKT
jgi:hypothetical protein